MTEKILPLLRKKRTRDPGLLLAILAVYDQVAKHVDVAAIAGEILPELWKMAMESQFTVAQFKVYPDFISPTRAEIHQSDSRARVSGGRGA